MFPAFRVMRENLSADLHGGTLTRKLRCAHLDYQAGTLSGGFPLAALLRGGRRFPGQTAAVIAWAWCVPERPAGYPVLPQVGHTGPLCPSEPGLLIPYLDTVALEFPELVIVGGHIGYPWTAEMIPLATKNPNVYIDTSACKAQPLPPRGLVDYLRGHGRHKVLFGSSHPAWPAADLFLHGNAERVFGLTEARPAREPAANANP